MTELLAIATFWVILSTIASFFSVWLKVTSAICEIIIGIVAAYILREHFDPNIINTEADWIKFVSTTGAIFLTFLAGTELNPGLFKEHWKSSISLGFMSFIVPFILCTLGIFFILHWTLNASYLAGIALSTTSVAVIYSIALELGINETVFGKKLLMSCFVTDFSTIVFLTLFFLHFSIKTVTFISAIILLILILPYSVKVLFKYFGESSAEFETKFLLLCLLAMGALASWAGLEAVLPAYILGVCLAKTVGSNDNLIMRLRTLTFGLLTPFYFISIGFLVSISVLTQSPLLIVFLFILKIITKALGIYPVGRFFGFRKAETVYTILLMGTGLTFGSIAALFGLTHNVINKDQYSCLIFAIVASAVFPTIASYIFFKLNNRKQIVTKDKK